MKKVEQGVTTYYVRSSVLGDQVVYELMLHQGQWAWARGYVYDGRQLLAQQKGGVWWAHQDPVTKSQRVTDSASAVVSTLELDPEGTETARSVVGWQQPPQRYTTYERNADLTDEAQMRRYRPAWSATFDRAPT